MRTANATTGASNLTSNMTLTSSLDIIHDGSGNLTIGERVIIGGAGGINKSGTGTLVLAWNNIYTGTTTISAGTLRLSNVDALQNTTLDTGTSGAQAVTFSVAGAHTYNIGAIQGGDELAFGNNTISVGSNNATTSFTGTLAGSGGSLTKAGTGTLTLSDSNTYDGTTTISAGTIQIDHANALGAGGNITFSGGGLKYGTTVTTDLSSRIKNSGSAIRVDTNGESVTWGTAVDSTNSGGLTKNGTGTLTLNATNTYTGSTTLNAGTLAVSGNIANSGLVINSGGIISPGTSAAADSFGTSSITINGGGYNWTLSSASGSAGTGYDQITSTGALTSSGLLTVNIYGTPGDWDGSANYSWDIFSANSVTGFSTGNFAYDLTNFNSGVTPAGTFTFSNPSGGIIRLSYTAPSDPVWAGGTGNWTTGFTTAPTDGANIAFAGATGGTATNNIPTGTLTAVGDIEFRSSAGAYTLAADAGSAGASGGTALTVNGSIINSSTATQTLNTDLAFAATRTIAANTGNITIGGAISGAGGLTKNGSNKLTLTAANTYTGDTTINTGTLEIGSGSTSGSLSSSSAITNNASLVFNRSNDLTVTNTIGGTGNLTKSGAGTLTLSGSSNYSGTTTISVGALRATHANALGSTAAGTTVTSGAALELSGGISIGAEALSLSGTGISSGGALRNISDNNSYAGAITLAAATLINSDSGNLTLSGNITGSNSLTKNGSGTLTLTGANTYTGATTINVGTLSMTGVGGYKTTALSVASGATLRINATGNATSSGANTAGTWSPFNSVNASITGAGVVALNGTNFISGGGSTGTMKTNLSAGGVLDVQSGSWAWGYGRASTETNLGSLNVASGAEYRSSDGAIKFDALTGSGTVANSYSGNITITLGVSNTTNNDAYGVSGNTATFSGVIKGPDTYTAVTTGTLNLVKTGSGTQILNGNNTYTGTTTVSAGTLEIGAAGRLGAGSYAGNISNNGTLIYSGNNNQTLSGIISGTGNLTQNASSTLTLSGANTYTGTTTVNAGTLAISNTMTIGAITGSGNLSLGNGFTLTTNSTSDSTFSGVISGSGALTKNGSSTLTLSGANTYNGTTTVNAGTLAIGNTMTIGAITGSGNLSLGNGFTLTTNSTSDSTFSGVISGSGALTKNGSSTLTLSGANTYSGATRINTGTLQIGNGLTTGSLNATSAITVNGTLAFNRSDDITQGTHFSTAAIGGTGSIVQNGAGTLTLNAANTYSGGTTLNTGTLVIGNAAAAGNGTITQANSSSLLKFDTTGTITNNMSVYNVLATQSATLSSAITVNNATWNIDTGDTLTISGAVSGNGGVTKNGGGMLTLNGTNTYNGSTVVNAGTLNANSTNALGSNNTVQVNGGTLLVTVDDAINGKNITMSTNTIGLQFSGNYSGAIGSLTLSANSIIDLGAGSVQILFQGLNNSSNHTLSFYNWSGTVGGNGTADTDKVYFGPDLSDAALAKIYFYTGPGDSFLGSGFDLGLKATGFDAPWNEGYQIIPGSTVPVVPEPETYATGLLLLLGGAVWMWKRKPKAV